jgi:nucleoside phosphorylase
MATDVNHPGTAAVPAARRDNVAVIFSLEREAAPFRDIVRNVPRELSIHVSGIGCERAREATMRLLSDSLPSLVIAAGFCGALSPSLRVGDIVTAARPLFLTSPLEGEVAASLWTRRVGGGVSGPDMPHTPPGGGAQPTSPSRGEVKNIASPRILTVAHLVADPVEKHRLAALHDADAVDMESAAIAEECAAKGVAFLAVRAVSDTADTALSPELVKLLAGGKVSVWKAIRALVRRPAMLGEFRRLSRDTKIAARKLAEELVRIIGSSI